MEFSVGLTPYSRFPNMPTLKHTVQLAEHLGFSGVSIGDHVVIPKDHATVISTFWYDPFVLATAIAACTTNLRILFNTLIAPYRHPLILAKGIASLDVLSGGRVIVGIGVGWIKGEFDALGLSFEQRGSMTDEYLKAIKAAWTDEPLQFRGAYASFEEIVFEPKPVQTPHPPIWIGGGVHRSLQRAATFGDGWHPLGRSWNQLKADVSTLKHLLVAQKRHNQDFTMSYTLFHESVAKQTSSHMQQAGGSEASVLSKDPNEAIEQIIALKQMGFRHLTIRFKGLNHDDLCDRMTYFKSDIMDPLLATPN